MDTLADFAAVAEIFSALTIVLGGLFAVFQLREYRRRERNRVTIELCRSFAEAELGRAVNLIRHLPDGIPLKDLQAMDDCYEEAAQVLGMTFESIGLMVQKRMASFEITQELTGGLLLTMWRKLENWIKETRVEHGNPRFGEWVQYLAERLDASEQDMTPAYEAHRGDYR